MKRLIKTVMIIMLIASMLYTSPSFCTDNFMSIDIYDADSGLIAVSAGIDMNKPFSEVLLYITYEDKLNYRGFDVEEQCKGAEAVDYGDNIVTDIEFAAPVSKTQITAFFLPERDAVTGSMFVFSVKAFVKYTGSEAFIEIKSIDDCVFVKGVYHVLLGDLNGDSRINTADAVVILSACAGKIKLSDAQEKAADFNNDNKINTADAKAILIFVVQN